MIVRAELETIIAGGAKVTTSVELVLGEDDDAEELGKRAGGILHYFATGRGAGAEEASGS